MGAYTLREPQHRVDIFMETTQTIYKQAKSYHDLHVQELLAKGWTIQSETNEYTIIGTDVPSPHHRQTSGGAPTTTGG
jgi:hypothetical protein